MVIRHPRRTDACCLDQAQVQARILHRLDRRPGDALDHVIHAAFGAGFAFGGAQDMPVFVHHYRENLGAAQVNPKGKVRLCRVYLFTFFRHVQVAP
jgi:hypothetical protein